MGNRDWNIAVPNAGPYGTVKGKFHPYHIYIDDMTSKYSVPSPWLLETVECL